MAFGVEIGLRNIVEDLSPQLGGDLDVNGFKIISLAGGNIVLAPDGTGYVYLDSDLYVTGTITGEHIVVSSPTPILVLRDNTYVGNASLGYLEWRDANNTRLGFFGNSSSGASDLLWKNESSGGHIGLQTTGAGNFAFLTGLAGFEVSGTYHERLNVGGNLGFDTVAEITAGQKDAMEAGLSEDVGGTLVAGEYHYDIRFDTAEGSSKPIYMLFGLGAVPDITVAENAKVVMIDLPISGDPRVVSRTIYRTLVNQNGNLAKPIYTINDNSTTTWTDDGSLTPSGPITYNAGNSTAGGITVANVDYLSFDEHNTRLGYSALAQNPSYDNVAIGSDAGPDSTGGGDIVLMGHQAGYLLTTGGVNTFVGKAAGRHFTKGQSNVCIGAYTYGAAGGAQTNYHVYIGKDAGYGAMRVSTDHGNTCVGAQSSYNFGGAYNVIMGYQAGKLAAGQTYNSYNVILGALCGQNFGGGAAFNILIGYDIDLDDPTGDYQLNIANLIKGKIDDKTLQFDAAVSLLERTADPAEPAEGECTIWMSDGSGKGDDGDVLIASKAGDVTKWNTLFDHSAGNAW